MDIVQAKYDELETVAKQFQTRAEANAEMQGKIVQSYQALQQGGWIGRGATAFFNAMSSEIFPAMQRLVEALGEARAVTLEIKTMLAEAEQEAASVFGGHAAEVVSTATVNGSGPETAATPVTGGSEEMNSEPIEGLVSEPVSEIPPGSLPGRPDPPPKPEAGDGSAEYGSVERSWLERRYDEAQVVLWNRVADGADAMGLDNAARNMRHYLGNSGSEQNVAPEAMLRDLPGFREKANQTFEYELLPQIDERIAKEYNGQPLRFQVTTEWQGYYAEKGESEDWYYAIGGFSYAHGADVIVTPNPDGSPHVEVEHQLHIFDRYNWDKGKGVDIMGVRVGDAQLGHLHEVGQAKEFEVWGTSGSNHYAYDHTGTSTGPVTPWGEGGSDPHSSDRTLTSGREAREQSRSPRSDDPTRNTDGDR